MQSTGTTLSFFIRPPSPQMRHCSIASALLTLLFGIARANASVNATASPTSLVTFPSTGDRSGTFASEPSSARDEERFFGNEVIDWGKKLVNLLAKSTQAVWKLDANTHLEAKIAWWRLTNAHPHFVFSELKLNEVGEDILSNFRFHEWVKYVKSYNLGHPNEKVSIVEKLRKQYGDLKLAVMLIQAQKDADTSLQAFATELQTELMLHRWRAENADPHSVYTKLDLNEVDEDILSNPWFRAWVNLVKDYNLKHPNEEVSIVEKLGKQYGYSNLAVMLKQAQKDADTSLHAVATELQTELMLYWRDRQIDAREVFSILRLDNIKLDYFTDPALNLWKIYVSEYNPGAPVTLFDQLYNSFGDVSLSTLLILEKRSEYTAALATHLQNQLLNLWLKKGVTPKDVFRYLKLNGYPEHLPNNPELDVWMKYCEMYRKDDATAVTPSNIIKEFFNAGDIKVIINTATTDYGEKLAKELKTPQAIGDHV